MSPQDAPERGPARPRWSQFAVLQGGKQCSSQGAAGAPGAAGPHDRPTLAWRSRLPVAVAFGVALVALVLWFLTAPSAPATLRQLPPEQRAALVERTLENLRDVCGRPDRPRDFCREQASLVLRLPECGPACQALARDELRADSAVR